MHRLVELVQQFSSQQFSSSYLLYIKFTLAVFTGNNWLDTAERDFLLLCLRSCFLKSVKGSAFVFHFVIF